MQKILIRHLSGSRANQLDQFPEETKEIMVGREPGIAVQYDPQNDDAVSRQHLKITRDASGVCQLCDLQSRNGTFLNHQRILRPVRLSHNDVVQLGTGGPEFRLELDPPPVEAKPTRFISPEHATAAGITREAAGPLPISRPVGRATVERMLDANFGQVRKQSNKSLQFVLAAALVLVVMSSVFYLRLEKKAEQSETLVGQQRQVLSQMDQQLQQQPGQAKAMREQIMKLSMDLQKSEARTARNFESISKALTTPNSSAERAQTTSDQDFDQKLQACWTAFTSNPAEGAKAAANLIKQYPNRWESYGIAGRILRSQNQPAQAKFAYERALELAPDSVKTQLVAVIQQINAAVPGVVER